MIQYALNNMRKKNIKCYSYTPFEAWAAIVSQENKHEYMKLKSLSLFALTEVQ